MSWTRLQWLADLKLKRSAEVLSQQQSALADAQQQADEFRAFKSQVMNGVRSTDQDLGARANALGFLDKLDEAIDLSDRRVETVESDVHQARLAWQQHKTKTDAYQSLIEQSHAMRLKREAATQDRLNQDQYAQRRFGRPD